MKKTGILLCLLTCLGASAQVALHGLFTPVTLHHDTTIIYPRDFLGGATLQGYTLPEGLKDHGTSKDTLVLTGSLKTKIDGLKLRSEGTDFYLPLIDPSGKYVMIERDASEVMQGEVRIIGAFNNWNRESPGLPLVDGKYRVRYYLQPGNYEYKFYINGKEVMDPDNAETVSNGMGGFNNVLRVAESGEKAPEPIAIKSWKDGIIRCAPLPDQQQVIALWNNEKLDVQSSKDGHMVFEIPEKALKIKRSYIRVFSFSGPQTAPDVLLPLHYGKVIEDFNQLDRSDWHQARMYFLMVDRFKNGKTANDRPTPDPSIHPKANYMGGDLPGVDQALKEGFFEKLHTNTIWLSPITQNPENAWGFWNKGTVKSTFSAYHGYWPIRNTVVDHRFATADELQNLLDDAHGRNQNVILDYVANHVHQDHPIYQKHKDWATSLYLPDGTKNTEKWDEHRLTTWFDDHLPTLDLRKWEVVDPLVDSAIFWIDAYSFDGFRHDATKHIDELYWRTLTYRVRQKTDKPIFQIGETYGSPSLINSYISTGMLDAQFDFNLYDAAVNAFATENTDMHHLKEVLEQGLNTYGHHHLMGNITGNQDRSRFISLASGDLSFSEDQKLAGWEREIGKPNKNGYRKLAMLHAFNNGVPGIPCIYYGDEFGMPGGNDPDNRRMMKFDNYDSDELELLEQVRTLNRLRGESLALIYGSTEIDITDNNVLIIHRHYLNESVWMLFNNSDKAVVVADLPKKLLSASRIDTAEKTEVKTSQIELEPLSYQIFKSKP